MAAQVRTQVLGTVRKPDGHTGEIDGLVIAQRADGGGWLIIDKPTAIKMAVNGLLWCEPPGHGKHVDIEAVDGDRDGYYDYVRTVPDYTRENNLLKLDVWHRGRRVWMDSQGRQKAA